MTDYGTIATNAGATGAPLTPCELPTQPIHGPNPATHPAEEVPPTQTTN